VSAGSVSGGGAGGRARWDEIVTTMPTTAALPQLLRLCAAGRRGKTARLFAESFGGDAAFTWLRITLSDVVVTHVTSSASSPDDSAEDQVGLGFGAIKVEKFSQGPDGSVGDPVVFAWDVVRNRGLEEPQPSKKERKAARRARVAEAAEAAAAAGLGS
jgi:type VI protein secretion system component Hcp